MNEHLVYLFSFQRPAVGFNRGIHGSSLMRDLRVLDDTHLDDDLDGYFE